MKKNLKQLVFFLCYCLAIFDITMRHAIGVSEFAHILLNFVAMPLLIVLIIDNLNGLTFKRALLMLGIVFFGILTRFITNNNAIMLICLFVCAFKDLNLDTIIKYNIPVRIFFLIALIILFNIGLTEATEYIRSDGIVRVAYGFGNLNNFSTYILSIVLQIVYLDRKNLKIRDLIIILIGFLIIVVLTASRTHEVMMIVLFIMVTTIILRNKSTVKPFVVKSKFARFVLTNSFLISLLFSVLLYFSFVNGSGIASTLDTFLSGRISSASRVINLNGISLFGQNVIRTNMRGEHMVLDNCYAYLLLYYGPIVTGAAIALFYKLSKRLFLERKDATAALIGLYNFTGLAELFVLEISMNIFLLNFSKIIFDSKKNGLDKETK